MITKTFVVGGETDLTGVTFMRTLDLPVLEPSIGLMEVGAYTKPTDAPSYQCYEEPDSDTCEGVSELIDFMSAIDELQTAW